MKYILILGSQISGIGKGIVTASIGLLLKSLGYDVTAIKIDPYLNTTASLLSPFEHGENFTLDDGTEVDLDLGNYERFLDIKLTHHHSITTGKVYQKVFDDEKKGKYLGKTVQIIPHVTDEIQNMIINTSEIIVDSKKPDICLIELGGTIADIESMPFIEALRQLQFKVGSENFFIIHICLVIKHNGEHKTKPVQRAIHDIRASGIVPNMMICRSKKSINIQIKEKIMLFSGLTNIIELPNLDNIFLVPQKLELQNVERIILKHFNYNCFRKYDINSLYYKAIEISNKIKTIDTTITIGIVGKYVGSPDTYLSIVNALDHAGYYLEKKINIIWIDSKSYSNDKVKNCNGILIPGGFGLSFDKMIGMIDACKFARENHIPLLGICLGFQIAIIEFCKNILNIENASSEEFGNSNTNVITLIKDLNHEYMNSTMWLGDKKIRFIENSYIHNIYSDIEINERFRCRYTVNNLYKDEIEKNGLFFTGFENESNRIVSFELINHPFYIGVQYHPEFKSKFTKPSPIFIEFLESTLTKLVH